MHIIIGKLSGFCDGVRFTIEKANEILNKYQDVYCLGEIVHNERVIEDLSKSGLRVVSSIEDIPNNSKMIIRAHGESKDVYDLLEKKKVDVFDLTCGKVKSVRIKVNRKKDDFFILIIGKKNHPETKGICSFAGEDSYILEDEKEIEDFIMNYQQSSKNSIYIVSQTTFNDEKFDIIVNDIKKKIPDLIVVDKTICHATKDRQEETRELSKKVDAMIIVGGKNSSNTKELEVVSLENCKNTFLVQTFHDLENISFQGVSTVGLMAGASTPVIIVEEIVDYLKSIK